MPVILHSEEDIRGWLFHGKLNTERPEGESPLSAHPVDFAVGNMFVFFFIVFVILFLFLFFVTFLFERISHESFHRKNNNADLAIPLSEFQKKKGITSFFSKAPNNNNNNKSEENHSCIDTTHGKKQQCEMTRGGNEPAKAKSEGKPPQKIWECELCTFQNPPGNQVCECCLVGTYPLHAVGGGEGGAGEKRKATVDISKFFSPVKRERVDENVG